MPIVYKIVNLETKRMYIGSTTKDTKHALTYWMYNCSKTIYKDYLLVEDYKKYGKKSFICEELASCDTMSEAVEIADNYIIQFNTFEPNGYNKSFSGIRKRNPDFYKKKKKQAVGLARQKTRNEIEIEDLKMAVQFLEESTKGKTESPEKTEPAEKQILESNTPEENGDVQFRKKAELLNKYGISGIEKNEVPEIFSKPETIKALRDLADNLENYGDQNTYEFVPAELNEDIKIAGTPLLSLLTDRSKGSTEDYMVIPKKNIQCIRCGKYKSKDTDVFYVHPDKTVTCDGFIHICSECIGSYGRMIFSLCNNAFYTLISLCQLTNVIFVQDVAKKASNAWIAKREDPMNLFRMYLTELKMGWLKTAEAPNTMLEFRNSHFVGDIFSFSEHHPATPQVFIEDLNEELIKREEKKKEERKNGLDKKWGAGFKKEEYEKLEDEFNKLEKFLPKKTELHMDALKKYIIYSYKERMALARGDLKDVKEWNALADKAADNAQLKIKQLSADFGDGVDSFAQLAETVEEYYSAIPTLPKTRKMPYDDIDFLIWQNVNYIRRLEGKPETSYEEVYSFIDDELTKKMRDSGMNEDQIKKEKEERNAVFQDLSDTYQEPLWLFPTSDEDEEDDDEGGGL